MINYMYLLETHSYIVQLKVFARMVLSVNLHVPLIPNWMYGMSKVNYLNNQVLCASYVDYKYGKRSKDIQADTDWQ